MFWGGGHAHIGLGALLPGAVGSRYRIFFSYNLLPSRRITEALLQEINCVCPRTLQSAPPERATDHVLTASVASRLMPRCTNNKGNSTTAPLAAIPCACAHGMPEPSNSQGVYAHQQSTRASPATARRHSHRIHICHRMHFWATGRAVALTHQRMLHVPRNVLSGGAIHSTTSIFALKSIRSSRECFRVGVPGPSYHAPLCCALRTFAAACASLTIFLLAVHCEA